MIGSEMPYETPPQSAPPGPVRARLEAAFGVGTAWTSEAGGSAVAWETPAYHLVWAAAAGTEAALRKVWKARKGRQAYPVVVLALLTREFTRLGRGRGSRPAGQGPADPTLCTHAVARASERIAPERRRHAQDQGEGRFRIPTLPSRQCFVAGRNIAPQSLFFQYGAPLIATAPHHPATLPEPCLHAPVHSPRAFPRTCLPPSPSGRF